MFDLDTLLEEIAHPTRKPANPREMPSSTASEDAGTLPASYPQAPANHPQADAPAPSRVDLRVMRVDAGNLPASGSSVQDGENPDLAGLRVDSGMSSLWASLKAPAQPAIVVEKVGERIIEWGPLVTPEEEAAITALTIERQEVWALGQALGFPRLEFSPGEAIAPGPRAWWLFAVRAPAEDIHKALKVLEGEASPPSRH